MSELTIQNLSSSIMAWLFKHDGYELSTTKANKMVSLCIARIFQEAEGDLGPIKALPHGPANLEALEYIRVPSKGLEVTEEEREEYFAAQTFHTFDSKIVNEIVEDICLFYGRFSAQQVVAFTHLDAEWKQNVVNSGEMNKELMLV